MRNLGEIFVESWEILLKSWWNLAEILVKSREILLKSLEILMKSLDIMMKSCTFRQYPMIGFDRNRSDLFRCNPVRNPLVRNPMKFGSVPTDFYMEFAGFRSNPISDSIVSGRIYRLDWITWDVYCRTCIEVKNLWGFVPVYRTKKRLGRDLLNFFSFGKPARNRKGSSPGYRFGNKPIFLECMGRLDRIDPVRCHEKN